MKFLSVNAFFSKERVVGKMRGRADSEVVVKLLKERV